MSHLAPVEALLLAHPTARAVLARNASEHAPPTHPSFRAAYARAQRLLGAHGSERPTPPAELSVARPHWTLLDWTRLLLLLHALQTTANDDRADAVARLLESGEIGEQESLLRTLALLPDAGRYVEVGLLACRTNAKRVFEAIACENSYPCSYFSEHGFNQMILKAIFVEVPVVRIEGLSARITPELRRMVTDFGSERKAAGRSVPADVSFILTQSR
jgi:hypothetical protein